jgi:hypothetical protein
VQHSPSKFPRRKHRPKVILMLQMKDLREEDFIVSKKA